MRWFKSRKSEHRQASYNDAITASLLQAAEGGTAANVLQTGALEAASGLISRAFMIADIEASPAIKAALHPQTMALIGRTMVKTGELVLYISVDDVGGVELQPCANVEVSGGVEEDSWRYKVELPAPGRSRKKSRFSADEVVHLRYSSDAESPWLGKGPLQNAVLAGKLSAELSRALADEASGPVGSLLPIPSDGQSEGVKELRADLRKANGKTLLVQGGDWNSAAGNVNTDWQPKRMGGDPPAALVQLAAFASNEIFSAIGISPSLFSNAGGGAAREGYRLFLNTICLPLSKIVEYELTRKLGPVEFSFSALAASDVTAKSRAYASLISSGMSADLAQKVTGIV